MELTFCVCETTIVESAFLGGMGSVLVLGSNSISGELLSAVQMDAIWTGQAQISVQPKQWKSISLYLPESVAHPWKKFFSRAAETDSKSSVELGQESSSGRSQALVDEPRRKVPSSSLHRDCFSEERGRLYPP